MILRAFPVGMLQSTCTILGCADTRQAAVIDPGADAPAIVALLEQFGLTTSMILHTHGHMDHVGATEELRASTGAPTWLHPADKPLAEQVPRQARMFGLADLPAPTIDHELSDGQLIAIGDSLELTVRLTPGHSPGGVCFYLSREGHQPGDDEPDTLRNASGVLVAGDTLFAGGVGRTDLWGGSASTLLRSIRTRILDLPDDTLVIPGHGPLTTVGEERRTNPFLTGEIPLG